MASDRKVLQLQIILILINVIHFRHKADKAPIEIRTSTTVLISESTPVTKDGGHEQEKTTVVNNGSLEV